MTLYCLSGSCFLQNRLKIRLGKIKIWFSSYSCPWPDKFLSFHYYTLWKKKLSSLYIVIWFCGFVYPLSITYSHTHSKRYIIYLFMKWDSLIPIEVLFNLNTTLLYKHGCPFQSHNILMHVTDFTALDSMAFCQTKFSCGTWQIRMLKN